VRTNYPNTVTLILTAHDRDFYLAEAVKAKVAGFLTKEEKPHRLVDAIRRAMHGDILITQEQLNWVSSWRKEVGERWENLTQRECQVLQLLGQGQDNVAIAAAIEVTLKTVEYHVTNILRKLCVTLRLEAVVWLQSNWPDEIHSRSKITWGNPRAKN
jgi:DNA-binding NarL/FixJ family response regulator